MENASKALIIAGAVLISILIIGLAVFLYNQASGTVNRANLNSQEAQAQNQPFEAYFGDKVSASDVKQLMSLVRTNNITSQTGNETKTIYVKFKGGEITTEAYTDPAKVSQNVKPGKTYKVKVLNSNTVKANEDETANTDGVPTAEASYYTSGYIRTITITEN